MKKLSNWWIVFWLVAFITLFCWGMVEGHETHLGDVGPQTGLSISGCQNGTYVVESKELGCFTIYKHVDLTHDALHIKQIELDQDGDCSCPEWRQQQ